MLTIWLASVTQKAALHYLVFDNKKGMCSISITKVFAVGNPLHDAL